MTSYGGERSRPRRPASTCGRRPRNGSSESPSDPAAPWLPVMTGDRTQRRRHGIIRPVASTLRGSNRPLTQLYDVALLDLDGVVYIGPDAVSGVPQALASAR